MSEPNQPEFDIPGEIVDTEIVEESSKIIVPRQMHPDAISPMAPIELEEESPWMRMIEVGLKSNADMDRLERLFAMQEKHQNRLAEMAANDGMSHFQATRVPVKKGKKVSYPNKDGTTTEYWHAELMDLVEGTREPMGEAGLSFTWNVEDDTEGKMTVACIVKHKHGHTFPPVRATGPYDQTGGKNAIQARQSTITYLQKTTFKAALGIAEGDPDDDGRNAGVEPGAAPETTTAPAGAIAAGQLRMLRAKIKAAKWDDETMCQTMGVAKLEDLPQAKVNEALKKLQPKA